MVGTLPSFPFLRVGPEFFCKSSDLRKLRPDPSLSDKNVALFCEVCYSWPQMRTQILILLISWGQNFEVVAGVEDVFTKCKSLFLGKRYALHRDLNKLDRFQSGLNGGGHDISSSLGNRNSGPLLEALREFYQAKIDIYRVAEGSGKWRELSPAIPMDDDILNEAIARIFLERKKFDLDSPEQRKAIEGFHGLFLKVQRLLDAYGNFHRMRDAPVDFSPYLP